jgi:hypothetical protein
VRPGRTALAALAAAALVVAAGPATAGASARGTARCTSGGARVLATNGQVAVVRRPRGRTYACLLSSGTRRALGDTAPGDGETTVTVRRFTLAGTVVAYNYEYSREEVEEGVSVLDVRRDHRPRTYDALSGVAAPRVGAHDAVRAIVVRPDRALAWIAYDDDVQPARYEVMKADAGAARPALLGAGPDIDPSSLALGGTAIYWLAAGVPQLARFGAG